MNSPVLVDVFVEDHAHEAFLVPILRRIAEEEKIVVMPRVRSGRGGHGRALTELKLYQDLMQKGASGMTSPDLLIVGIDGNCSNFARAKKAIVAATQVLFSDRLVVACPDPHVERWYLADPESFKDVVGLRPSIAKKKCARDYYKDTLAKVVQKAGHPATLGGIEFAHELVEHMNLYRAGRNERSLKAFVDDFRCMLRTIP
jgi:hypothetical protein